MLTIEEPWRDKNKTKTWSSFAAKLRETRPWSKNLLCKWWKVQYRHTQLQQLISQPFRVTSHTCDVWFCQFNPQMARLLGDHCHFKTFKEQTWEKRHFCCMMFANERCTSSSTRRTRSLICTIAMNTLSRKWQDVAHVIYRHVIYRRTLWINETKRGRWRCDDLANKLYTWRGISNPAHKHVLVKSVHRMPRNLRRTYMMPRARVVAVSRQQQRSCSPTYHEMYGYKSLWNDDYGHVQRR